MDERYSRSYIFEAAGFQVTEDNERGGLVLEVLSGVEYNSAHLTYEDCKALARILYSVPHAPETEESCCQVAV